MEIRLTFGFRAGKALQILTHARDMLTRIMYVDGVLPQLSDSLSPDVFQTYSAVDMSFWSVKHLLLSEASSAVQRTQ